MGHCATRIYNHILPSAFETQETWGFLPFNCFFSPKNQEQFGVFSVLITAKSMSIRCLDITEKKVKVGHYSEADNYFLQNFSDK